MAHQAAGKVHNLVGDASMQHQFAREDKKRNGKEREHVHARNHGLERGGQWHRLHGERGETAQANSKCHRQAEQQQDDERDAKNSQCHEASTFLPVNNAIRCSIEKSRIRMPAMIGGTYRAASEMPRIGIVLLRVDSAISTLPTKRMLAKTMVRTPTAAAHQNWTFFGNSPTSESMPICPASRTTAEAPNMATEMTSNSATCSTNGGGRLKA